MLFYLIIMFPTLFTCALYFTGKCSTINRWDCFYLQNLSCMLNIFTRAFTVDVSINVFFHLMFHFRSTKSLVVTHSGIFYETRNVLNIMGNKCLEFFHRIVFHISLASFCAFNACTGEFGQIICNRSKLCESSIEAIW